MHIVTDLQQTLFLADNMIHAPLKKNVSTGLDLGGPHYNLLYHPQTGSP